MAPELRGMTYEERLRDTGAEERGGGDLIQVYKLMTGMDVVDKEKLLLREEVTSLRCHSRTLMMGRCLKNVTQLSIPQRSRVA
ncbi:hypothetical protein E2C01_095572 [Portunus trituberculatus]|uniref:Uncharacterized protein n=1 Tax=Portunus trituberculatus TaxID=210409 RepID=A0A5B7JTC8_PORTR|nr:hypothetical protein [Portunus trituberculatus]